jgi:hypothetical protein
MAVLPGGIGVRTVSVRWQVRREVWDAAESLAG